MEPTTAIPERPLSPPAEESVEQAAEALLQAERQVLAAWRALEAGRWEETRRARLAREHLETF